MVLTLKSAKTIAASGTLARVALAAGFAASALIATPISAEASRYKIGGCLGGWATFSCVTVWGEPFNPTPYIRLVPQPEDDADRARAAERDRKWLGHCRPVIQQDAYGVARYQYAAQGCEFGVGAF